MLKMLNNKKGFSYILTCVMILGIVMAVYTSLQYAAVYHIAREQKNETKLKLDSFVTSYAVENYNALKQGEAWSEYIDRDLLVNEVYTLLGFPKFVTLEYKPTAPVEGKYIMSEPDVYALAGDSFGVLVEYEISIPFEVFGYRISDIIVPIEIISRYTELRS